MQTLSKSDFQLATNCPKKLVYKKAGYPTSNDCNEYMEMLAQGGYIVGYMATLLFPEGVEIKGSTSACIALTKEYLLKDNCTLFEAAIESNQKLVRIDVLKKTGNKIHLIEVKAKSHHTEEDLSKQKKKLETYIEDAAYQYLVLSEAYPELEIECSLLMPDKAKRTAIDGLAGWFSIKPNTDISDKELEEIPTQTKPKFNKPEVVFKYENDIEKTNYVSLLMSDGILDYLPVTSEVISLQPVINNRAALFLDIIENGINARQYKINKNCKNCEFQGISLSPNGLKECWGDLAIEQDHIFDLYYGGSIGTKSEGFYLNELIDHGKTSLWDIDKERLKKTDGTYGARAIRALIQLENTKNKTEWISDQLESVINEFKYPLHFIDFETYTGAIPYHKGMRPYELIAFQWSCHTINYKGAIPVHKEWIHTSNDFPNFDFAISLMNLIGNSGTPFMWATHENTVLKTILNQMSIFEYENAALGQWIINMTTDSKLKRVGTLVNMNTLTQDYYFHPYMKGRTSIKKVLPAIWNNNLYLHTISYFKDYAQKDFLGGIVDPYDTLAALSESDAEDEVVAGGTAAMRAYQRIRFDDTLSDSQKVELKNQLLQYCKLDTMAMVIIGYHWGMR